MAQPITSEASFDFVNWEIPNQHLSHLTPCFFFWAARLRESCRLVLCPGALRRRSQGQLEEGGTKELSTTKRTRVSSKLCPAGWGSARRSVQTEREQGSSVSWQSASNHSICRASPCRAPPSGCQRNPARWRPTLPSVCPSTTRNSNGYSMWEPTKW